jgi:hypothetical protein
VRDSGPDASTQGDAGAEMGTRLYASGDERSVLKVFELFEPSDYITFDVHLAAPGAAAIEMEDWTKNLKTLCKACSEGRAHEQHDHSLESDEWQLERRIGLASKDASAMDSLIERWVAAGKERRIDSVES